jgi:enterochelin esterase family protein
MVRLTFAALAGLSALAFTSGAVAQATNQNPVMARPSAAASPEFLPDGRVTLRLRAPNAASVSVASEGANLFPPVDGRARGVMVRGENGVWSITTPGRAAPGAYRYTFNVDGVQMPDPANVDTSQTMTNLRSLLVVPGDYSETRAVAHGALSEVRYKAATLGGVERRMYVYTPPGYAKDGKSYPVMYLIHGGGDTDHSWPTIGRANDILDNLIAEGRAKPMIVVMPSGWTPTGPNGARASQVFTSDASKDPFSAELIKDIIPYVDANYRTLATSDQRALAGLSMGGIQTLNIGLHHLGTFDYVVVMSSGWQSEADRAGFFEREAAKIPTYNSKLKLFWWGWGETDIARENGLNVIGRFKAQGVKIETRESPGGHTWDNWRLYLNEVAPKLFR